jgi:hypothetical protein
MEIRTLVILIAVIIVFLIILLVIWLMWIRRWFMSNLLKPRPLQEIFKVRSEAEEFVASSVGEEIEELVRQNLTAHPDLADTNIDFGTAADGSLQIWLGDQCYQAIEEIPDGRVQEAIKQAVTDFNR